MDSSSSYLTELAQLLCLAVAVTAGFIAAATYRYRQRESALASLQRSSTTPGKIVYHDAPTVRVVDPQRVDRMRKIVRLTAGEQVDMLQTHPGLEPRFRLTLKSVASGAEGDVAHLLVQFGGTRVSCGPLVQELSFNEFSIPRAQRDEARSSIFHYHENGSSLDFMRIKVRSLDVAAGTAELDVMQVCSRWPAAD